MYSALTGSSLTDDLGGIADSIGSTVKSWISPWRTVARPIQVSKEMTTRLLGARESASAGIDPIIRRLDDPEYDELDPDYDPDFDDGVLDALEDPDPAPIGRSFSQAPAPYEPPAPPLEGGGPVMEPPAATGIPDVGVRAALEDIVGGPLEGAEAGSFDAFVRSGAMPDELGGGSWVYNPATGAEDVWADVGPELGGPPPPEFGSVEYITSLNAREMAVNRAIADNPFAGRLTTAEELEEGPDLGLAAEDELDAVRVFLGGEAAGEVAEVGGGLAMGAGMAAAEVASAMAGEVLGMIGMSMISAREPTGQPTGRSVG